MAGRLLRNIREHDRCVGGIDETSTRRAAELYTPVLTTGKVIPMTATAAEVTKTAENTFRDLQIAAINELALYCEAMGINVYDVRTGIDSLKGEGITRAMLWPGAGVGGHCLTKDTYHLERGVQVLGKGALDYPAGEPSLYVLARRINDFMPVHMFRLTMDALKRAGLDPLNGAKVAILGWAFLSNSDDTRNTPAEPYRDLLHRGGAVVLRPRPVCVPNIPACRSFPYIEEAVKDADAIVIFAGHHQYQDLDPAVSSRNYPARSTRSSLTGGTWSTRMPISARGSSTRGSGAGTRIRMRLWKDKFYPIFLFSENFYVG